MVQTIINTLTLVFTDPDYTKSTTVEMRRNALDSLETFFTLYPASLDHLLPANWALDIVKCLTIAMDDYTCDHRGDVGSWVRLSALKALLAILPRILMSLMKSNELTQLLGLALSHAAERLEKLRIASVRVINYILYSKSC